MKKFELSAYGVEEMNRKELIIVNGGEFIPVGNPFYDFLLEIIIGIFVNWCFSDDPPVGYNEMEFTVTADSTGVFEGRNPDGSYIYYSGLQPNEQFVFKYKWAVQ